MGPAFRLDAVKVGQLGGSVDGLAALQAADHRVHQQGVGQGLLHVLRVLRIHTEVDDERVRTEILNQ